MNRTAQRYFDFAHEYYVAALTLHLNIFEAPYLYNPTAFLLRHSIELLLKGLIIRETHKIKIIAANKIKVEGSKLNNCHSLLSLWNYFKKLHPLDEENIKKLNDAIKKLNKKDFGSQRYRYPYKKNGQPIPVEPVAFDLSGKSPDLEEGIPFLIETADDAEVIAKGHILLMDIQTLLEQMEILFDLSEED